MPRSARACASRLARASSSAKVRRVPAATSAVRWGTVSATASNRSAMFHSTRSCPPAGVGRSGVTLHSEPMADRPGPLASWLTRDDGFVPKARYLDPEFLALELDHMWSRVWQIACREEELAEPGDYAVYDIGDQS